MEVLAGADVVVPLFVLERVSTKHKIDLQYSLVYVEKMAQRMDAVVAGIVICMNLMNSLGCLVDLPWMAFVDATSHSSLSSSLLFVV